MQKTNYISKLISIFLIILAFLFPLSTVIAQEATDSSETIREKVKEKLDRAMNKPKAYMGLITDITDSTIQINNLEGEIQQIVILPDETTFVNVADNEEIEYSDVAIGDKIVAVGMIDENGTLNGLRVLVTSTENEIERVIYNAQVVSVEGKIITIKDFDKGEVELSFPRGWKGPEIVEFEEGQNVAAVAINDEGTLTIRTIEILLELQFSEEVE